MTATWSGTVPAISPGSLTIDPYTPLAHKRYIEPTGNPQGTVQSWVPAGEQRRLNAYLLLTAYQKNAARFWIRDDDAERVQGRREYGDPALIVQAIRAAILGDDVRPVVEGADGEVGEEPTREDFPETDDGKTAFDEELAEWKAESAKVEAAVKRQEEMDDWWAKERGKLKLVEAENHAVGLGDGVYCLGVDTEKKRVRLRVYDPGWYFPVLDPGASDPDEFPNKVHVAWEWEDEDTRKKYVRRITWERVFTGEDRQYAYAEESSKWETFLTDATWDLTTVTGKLKDLRPGDATFQTLDDGTVVENLPLGIDFIPVVHVPNTVALTEFWGESSLSRVSQILDDIAATDTDLQTAAATSAAPPLATDDGSGVIDTYGPGQIVPKDSQLLDTSRSLDALLKFLDALLDRLSIIRQLPAAVLGRIKPNEVPSGISMLLGMSPFKQLVADYRLVRDDKYQLLLKMWQRMSIAAGFIKGEVLDASMAFGSFLPNDVAAIKEIVLGLYKEHVISKATAIAWLRDVGVPIESIEEEIAATEREDFAGAKLLSDATMRDTDAQRYLQLEVDEDEPVEETASVIPPIVEPPVEEEEEELPAPPQPNP